MVKTSALLFCKVNSAWKGGANMDTHRAQEISNSKNMISVTYNGDPIYIEHVDQSE